MLVLPTIAGTADPPSIGDVNQGSGAVTPQEQEEEEQLSQRRSSSGATSTSAHAPPRSAPSHNGSSKGGASSSKAKGIPAATARLLLDCMVGSCPCTNSRSWFVMLMCREAAAGRQAAKSVHHKAVDHIGSTHVSTP